LHFISDDTFRGFRILATLTPVYDIEPTITTSVPYKNNDANARGMVPHLTYSNLEYS